MTSVNGSTVHQNTFFQLLFVLLKHYSVVFLQLNEIVCKQTLGEPLVRNKTFQAHTKIHLALKDKIQIKINLRNLSDYINNYDLIRINSDLKQRHENIESCMLF